MNGMFTHASVNRGSFRVLSISVLIGVAAAAPGVSRADDAPPLVIRGETIHTMGPAGVLRDAVILVQDGKIAAVGPASSTAVPAGARVLTAKVVTPGLIDAHSTVGLSGIYNQRHDSDQLERSNAVQPELRALDAYNAREPLIAWVRSFGVTTIHTGHAPGELISGQTLIVKTRGGTVEAALVREPAAVAATLGDSARKSGDKSPGTRAKMAAMLRAELVKAREYAERREKLAADAEKQPERNLRLEALGRVLSREAPLMLTVDRAQDIASALRLAEEFNLKLWIDSCAECGEMLPAIKAAGAPVLLHAPMRRAYAEFENASFATAARLKEAGILFAIQAGYESYVPKTRVVLFEAAIAAANGLDREAALASITIDAAKILEIASRVGSLEIGKDADVALYDGDPFEHLSHCVGVVIDGQVVSEVVR